MQSEAISAERCVVRNTAGRKGRAWSVAPGSTASRHLHYGRIILDRGGAPLYFNTKELETGFVCLKG
ncbi:MAG: 5-deoxy-glucuronate isomerase, partial [Vicinamibacterales bacterium]